MSLTIPTPWPRPNYSPNGPARLSYLVLLPEPIQLAREGHPLFDGFSFELRYRGDDLAWFDGWTDPKGLYGSLLLRTPGVDIAALASCKVAAILRGTFEDPKDLGYLQRAFVILRTLAKNGAVAALDLEAILWWPRSDLEELEDDFDFELGDHVRVVFEAREREPGVGHLCHTLGMAKFGQPDLALGGLAAEHAEAASEMLGNLAQALAEGEVFGPGDVIEPDGFPPLVCEPVEDDSGSEEAIFSNRSLWLVPEEA